MATAPAVPVPPVPASRRAHRVSTGGGGGERDKAAGGHLQVRGTVGGSAKKSPRAAAAAGHHVARCERAREACTCRMSPGSFGSPSSAWSCTWKVSPRPCSSQLERERLPRRCVSWSSMDVHRARAHVVQAVGAVQRQSSRNTDLGRDARLTAVFTGRWPRSRAISPRRARRERRKCATTACSFDSIHTTMSSVPPH